MVNAITRRSFVAGTATMALSNKASALCTCGTFFEPPGRNVVIDYAPRDVFEEPAGAYACKPFASTIAISPDFAAAKADGVRGVIRRATGIDGWADIDKASYRSERHRASKSGLLWGSYHFSARHLHFCDANLAQEIPGDIQADMYLMETNPEPNDLVCLDMEEPGVSVCGTEKKKRSIMGPDQAVQFIERVKEKVGRYPILNTRSLILNAIPMQQRSRLLKCKLWLSEYVSMPSAAGRDWNTGPVLPNGVASWEKKVLWQWADDVVSEGDCIKGINRQGVHGIRKCDRNTFHGGLDELRRFWVE